MCNCHCTVIFTHVCCVSFNKVSVSVPLPLLHYPFPSIATHSRTWLITFRNLPSRPLIPNPLPSPSLPSPPPMARGLGKRYSSPSESGRARPPNAFWCNSQPKICKSGKVLPTCTKRPCNVLMTFFRNADSVRVVSSSSGSRQSQANKYIKSQIFHKWCYKISHFMSTCSFRQC